jgi:hypothetical protein
MTEYNETKLSRRTVMARIGGLAVTAYTVPSFTTLSTAQAASSASAASAASAASSASPASAPSAASGPSGPSNTMTSDECESGGGSVVTSEDGVTLVCQPG